MLNRGGLNIDYSDGFAMEEKYIAKYDFYIKQILDSDYIESATRTIVDQACGIDIYATIKENVYGVSLRVRTSDFHSFTLSRHVNDQYSEILKWVKQSQGIIKPAYHIQINEGKHYFTITKIDVQEFSLHLNDLIHEGKLESYYNTMLLAYEFRLSELTSNEAITKKIIYK
ncbi:hypothetical protein [Sediminicola arcticus]|uniref:Uncharacterized protein n=1 Tax=Sediminicola arcticus TaxID=1574308 RepID=A0ABV2SUZ3_9FLAO